MTLKTGNFLRICSVNTHSPAEIQVIKLSLGEQNQLSVVENGADGQPCGESTP